MDNTTDYKQFYQFDAKCMCFDLIKTNCISYFIIDCFVSSLRTQVVLGLGCGVGMTLGVTLTKLTGGDTGQCLQETCILCVPSVLPQLRDQKPQNESTVIKYL